MRRRSAEPPDERFQREAFAYAGEWMRVSAEFTARHTTKWRLLRDLYLNRVDLASWSKGGSSGAPGEEAKWRADIVLSPSYIVDNWTDKAYQSVFSGPEWLTVLPEAVEDPHDERFPISYKAQELLLAELNAGHVHTRLYEALQATALYGSVFAKVSRRQVGHSGTDWAPCLEIIPLERLLTDGSALHQDVQRHSGIGHTSDKSYAHIMEQFRRNVYTLNFAEFKERWPEPEYSAHDEIEDTDGESGISAGRFTVWEWHGAVPTDRGFRECVCVIVTDRGAASPEDGVMVRLMDGPVLVSGLRPFVAAQYTPLPGPFGMGAVECNLDLIYAISQFLSQSQDNARLTAHAQLVVRRGSSAARQITAEDNTVYPGKVWMVEDPGDIRPFPPLQFPQTEVNTLIDYLNGLLEKRTAVNELSLGMGSGVRTATEAHILQEATMAPFHSRTDLFARTFLEPLGAIALGMIQQCACSDQVITVRGSGGRDMPVRVGLNELRSGRFRVAATLTRQDAVRVAKAQSIERILPTLLQFRPILADEGTQVSFSEILKRWLDLLGVEGSDRVFQRSAREAPAFAREAATPASGMDHESVPYAPPTTTDAGVHAAILQKAALQAAP